MEDDTLGIEVCLISKYSPALLSKCHEVSDVLIRGDHLDLGDRLFDMDIGSRLWEILRIGYMEIGTVSSFSLYELRTRTRVVGTFIADYQYLIRHLRTRDDDVHSVFSPETLLHDI